MAIEDQVRFPKTPATGAEAGNKSIVDSNVQVKDVLYIPVGETDTLNGGKDRAGAIRITDGKFKVYMGNGVWAEYLVESDGLKEVGDLVLAGNSLTVTAPIKWRINSVEYEKLTDSVFTITNATTGYNRIDLVYAKTDNTLAIIEGVETMGVAVEPTLPANTIRVAPVYITGSDIAPPAPDLTNYYTKGQVDALLATLPKQNATSGIPTPDNANSANGDFYYKIPADESSLELFQKISGVWVSVFSVPLVQSLTFEDGVQKVGTTVSADSSVVRLNPSVAQSGSINVRKVQSTGIDNLGSIFTDIDENQAPGQGGTQTTLAFVSDGNRFDFRYQPGNSSSVDRIRARTPNTQQEFAYLSDIASASSTAVQKSGDTMTGDLILSSPTPPNTLSATPKAYVDNAIAASAYSAGSNIAIAGNVVGVVNNPTFSGTVTAPNFNGLASSATKLATARLINGVAFNGTADITLAYPIVVDGSTYKTSSTSGGSTTYSNFFGFGAGGNATNASYSNFFGKDAGYNAINAANSNFFGGSAGYGATSASYSNFFGKNAGYTATNAVNSNFFGGSAGYGATGATYSNFFGGSAGYGATGASYSNFFGKEVGVNATGASNSNFFGVGAGNGATNASYSNFFGYNAGYTATNAANSNFFGKEVGVNATGASNSNFFGVGAGNGATNASYSNFFGYNAGKAFTGNNIGTNNIIIGTNISLPNATANAINIGGVLFGKGTNSSTGGNPSIVPANGKIGINIVSPTEALDVLGNTKVSGTITAIGDITAPNFNGLASNSSKWAGIPYVGNIAFPTTFTVGDASNNGGYASLPQSRIALGIGDGSNLDNTVTGSKALDVINVNEVLIGRGFSSGALYINYGGIAGGVTRYIFTNGANTGAKSDIEVKTTITDGFTVATLPTGVIGMRAYVTDALTPTYLGVAIGGGAITCPVFFNGTNWIT